MLYYYLYDIIQYYAVATVRTSYIVVYNIIVSNQLYFRRKRLQ